MCDRERTEEELECLAQTLEICCLAVPEIHDDFDDWKVICPVCLNKVSDPSLSTAVASWDAKDHKGPRREELGDEEG